MYTRRTRLKQKVIFKRQTGPTFIAVTNIRIHSPRNAYKKVDGKLKKARSPSSTLCYDSEVTNTEVGEWCLSFLPSEVGLVKYWYDEQLAVILAFLVGSLVSENATRYGYSKQGASRGVAENSVLLCEHCCWNAVSRKSPVNSSHYTCTTALVLNWTVQHGRDPPKSEIFSRFSYLAIF